LQSLRSSARGRGPLGRERGLFPSSHGPRTAVRCLRTGRTRRPAPPAPRVGDVDDTEALVVAGEGQPPPEGEVGVAVEGRRVGPGRGPEQLHVQAGALGAGCSAPGWSTPAGSAQSVIARKARSASEARRSVSSTPLLRGARSRSRPDPPGRVARARWPDRRGDQEGLLGLGAMPGDGERVGHRPPPRPPTRGSHTPPSAPLRPVAYPFWRTPHDELGVRGDRSGMGASPNTWWMRRRSCRRGSVSPPTQRLTVLTETPSCRAAASCDSPRA
jgi:hypothetical protein